MFTIVKATVGLNFVCCPVRYFNDMQSSNDLRGVAAVCPLLWVSKNSYGLCSVVFPHSTFHPMEQVYGTTCGLVSTLRGTILINIPFIDLYVVTVVLDSYFTHWSLQWTESFHNVHCVLLMSWLSSWPELQPCLMSVLLKLSCFADRWPRALNLRGPLSLNFILKRLKSMETWIQSETRTPNALWFYCKPELGNLLS